MEADLSTLRLVPLKEGYIPAILDIEQVVNGAPWSYKSFTNELDHDHGIFKVAILDAIVVGYAALWLLVDEAHITTVAIAPDYQRRGIGRLLTIEILNEARDRGMLSATLEVRAGNEAAISLYENLGFKNVAVRKGYYPDNREDAVVMWLYDLDSWSDK
ncbi:MAG: ribosomal protein S18-alanine N-acetyltransferase [Armatimonadetes bacterium]|nr:ribosomal protein S18-alanine N-acetyltransferase [Armatimonadota bacterium]